MVVTSFQLALKMLRDLATEALVLGGLFLCVNLMVPFWVKSLYLPSAIMSLCTVGLVYFSKIHIQGLLSKSKKVQLIIFLTLITAIVLLTGYNAWELNRPRVYLPVY